MILVIGYGNSLCGDDGIGPYAVEALFEALARDNYASTPPLDCRSIHQLTPELAEPISKAEAVIFVDAAFSAPAASITYQELSPLLAEPESTTSALTHHASPSMLLESAEALYGHRPMAYLFTMSGTAFEPGDSFSPAVTSALPVLVDMLKAKVKKCTSLALPNL